MNTKPVKKTYRITHSTDRRSRYALLDETDAVVAIHDSVFHLSALAFDGVADELRHDYLLTENDTTGVRASVSVVAREE